MKYVFDAYAWVEYFNGTLQGKKVDDILIKNPNKIYTNSVTVAELASYFARHGRSFDAAYSLLASLSRFSIPSAAFGAEVGDLYVSVRRKKKKFGLADAFVLQTARKLRGVVVTGDEDFRGLKDVLMLQ